MMLRLINEHVVRAVQSLDGLWDFVTQDERTESERLPAKYPRSIRTPSCWESIPGLESYRGVAWFRKRVAVQKGKALRLVFGGVSHTGTVFVDGKKVGQHYDAYGAWDVVVPPTQKSHREIVIKVDNTLGEHSVLHKEDDYYTYGGLIRPIEAHAVPEVFIDKLFASPSMARGGKWALDIRIRLRNWSRKNCRRSVEISVADKTLQLPAADIKPGDTEVTARFTGLAVKDWTAENPNLYEIAARLVDDDQAVDDLIDRFGFRQIRTGRKKLLLNGKTLRLRGYNRHEDHPTFGCSIPVELMAHDLALLRDLGCNFVRTSHYPNDMRFLDMCDELGFYVWTESHTKTVNLKHKLFREQVETATRDMMEWQYNHPCIVIWGALNECDEMSAMGQRQHRWTMELMRGLDSTRPITYAQFTGNPAGFALVDIISFNTYPGWYYGGMVTEELVKMTADGMAAGVRNCEIPGVKDKPVIFSEFGAGALPGFNDRRCPKWSEDYQAKVLDLDLKEFLNHAEISGAAIWQFCDVRASSGALNARQMNNKGSVDENRNPKRAYYAVKQQMLAAAKRTNPS